MEDPRTHRLMLDTEPEIAQQIGIILSGFAIIELCPPTILARLTGMSRDDAEVVLGHHRSFMTRLDVIDALANSRSADDPEKAPALAMIDQIRESAKIRNKYAHALWQGVAPTEKTSEVHMIGWIADANRKTSRTVVSLEQVIDDCATVRATVYHATNYGPLNVPYPQP
jgi:hypothetical protein